MAKKLHLICYLLLFSLLGSSEKVYRKNQFISWVRLGTGAYSTVYRAVDVQNGNALVSIKDVNAERGTWGRNQNQFRLTEELNILTAISATGFTRVVHYYGRFDQAGHTYLVMEYCPYGTLADHLTRNGRMSYEAAASVMYQLASTVALLHQKGFAHGDLHSGNVMISAVDTQVQGNLYVKVIDFGHSGTYMRGRNNVQWRWNHDIHFLGDLLDAMLPANYAWDYSPIGVTTSQLVARLREDNENLRYTSQRKPKSILQSIHSIDRRVSEVLYHPFVQSGKELASKWPMYA